MYGVELMKRSAARRRPRPAAMNDCDDRNKDMRHKLSLPALAIGGASFGNIVIPGPLGAFAGGVLGLAIGICHRVYHE